MASRNLTIHVDLEQLQRLTAAGAVISFTVMFIAIIGEVLGWWNGFGELAGVMGGFLGLMLTIATFFLGATGKPAKTIAIGVADGNRKHDVTNAKLGGANAKLDGIDAKLDAANAKHDVGNEKLDRHTELLTQIRDALRRP